MQRTNYAPSRDTEELYRVVDERLRQLYPHQAFPKWPPRADSTDHPSIKQPKE